MRGLSSLEESRPHMGDVSADPSMEDILASIKRIIAEDVESGGPVRARRRAAPPPEEVVAEDDVLELSEEAPESIVSGETADASGAPLDTLSRLVVKPETAGAYTLEGLVREMLRPMLREWLDQHLPELVESMVAKEIARITGGRCRCRSANDRPPGLVPG